MEKKGEEFQSFPETRSQAEPMYALAQNYPNPFSAGGGSASGENPLTTISYQLSAISFVRLGVYDVLGREVAILVDAVQNAGSFTVRWDATSSPSGVYFYRLQIDGQAVTKRMNLVR